MKEVQEQFHVRAGDTHSVNVTREYVRVCNVRVFENVLEGNSEKKKRNFAISTVSTTSTTSDKGVNERSIAIVAVTMILVTTSRDRK